MFRKLTLVGLTLLLGMVIAACSGENANTNTPENNAPNASDNEQSLGNDSEINQPGENDIVARVNGIDILGSTYLLTYQEVQMSMQQQGQDVTDENVAKELHQHVIDSIVGNELIIQDANDKGYTPEENQINEQLETITSGFETEEELNAALEQSNLTLEKLKSQIQNDIVIQMYIDNEIELSAVSDEQVREVYDQATAQTEDAPPLEEVEDTIKQSIQQQEIQTKMVQIVENLKANSEIEVLI